MLAIFIKKEESSVIINAKTLNSVENITGDLTCFITYSTFFTGCNETLTGVGGTFHSPNYPRQYPDGQYCSWRITVSPKRQIHLTFTDFNLQNDNNTDGLYVYDGENSTGKVLGVFYGGHLPPKEGINSSSNHMFLIFKSDKSVSDTGFRAWYNADTYLLDWPAGSYGIPKAASGCPYGEGFQWRIGQRNQDTEDNTPRSYKSPRFHLDATVSKTNVERSFCVKTDTSTDMRRRPWPAGKISFLIDKSSTKRVY